MPTKLQQYKDAGLKVCPSGSMNEHLFQKVLGNGIFSVNDSTWKKEGKKNGRYVGQHTCCGSKRSYRHKAECPYIKDLQSDDLSDLK